MNEITKSFQYGEHAVTLKSGKIARQASGAVFALVAAGLWFFIRADRPMLEPEPRL